MSEGAKLPPEEVQKLLEEPKKREFRCDRGHCYHGGDLAGRPAVRCCKCHKIMGGR